MTLSFWVDAVWIGIGATLFMDFWAILQKKICKLPSLDYAMVGRWFGLMFKGKFYHESIVNADKVKLEKQVGWLLHFTTGIMFAALHIIFWGETWLQLPTIGPAMLTGIVTTAVPFLIMQPAFGLGVAASKTVSPISTRLRSLAAHSAYGFGIYVMALIL